MATGSRRAGKRGVRVLVATDGSRSGRAAVAAAAAFPWPRGATVHGVVARRGLTGTHTLGAWPGPLWAALDRALERVRSEAQAVLARRWPAAEVAIVDESAVEAILGRARRVRATVIVVGSRGHNLVERFVLGSVSRAVVRGARCPVLVVKGRARPVRRLIVAVDGSPHARRAVELVAGLQAPAGGHATVVRVVEPVRVPSMGLAPGAVRSAVWAQAEELTAQRVAAARRELDAAARRLARTGWAVKPVVRRGVPLPELLRAVTSARADALVLGARGVGGMARLLLGSVAEGALSRSPVSVLLVR
jgi:nucleotide-binding universal stress UspA family protein